MLPRVIFFLKRFFLYVYYVYCTKMLVFLFYSYKLINIFLLVKKRRLTVESLPSEKCVCVFSDVLDVWRWLTSYLTKVWIREYKKQKRRNEKDQRWTNYQFHLWGAWTWKKSTKVELFYKNLESPRRNKFFNLKLFWINVISLLCHKLGITYVQLYVNCEYIYMADRWGQREPNIIGIRTILPKIDLWPFVC